jgi:hypothetical protein
MIFPPSSLLHPTPHHTEILSICQRLVPKMTIPSHTGPSETAPPHSSGIKVIVVGLGIGGLAAAIECHRKGHTVLAFDKIPVHTDTRKNYLSNIYVLPRMLIHCFIYFIRW